MYLFHQHKIWLRVHQNIIMISNQMDRQTNSVVLRNLIWSIGTGSKNIHGQNLFDGRVLQNNYLHFHINDMSNSFVYYSHPIPAFHTLLPKTFKRTICWKLTFQIILWKLWMIRFISKLDAFLVIHLFVPAFLIAVKTSWFFWPFQWIQNPFWTFCCRWPPGIRHTFTSLIPYDQ